MQGHIRSAARAAAIEYIVDIGVAQAQRCQGCGRRFWVERKPRAACPRCGGEAATERGAPPRDQGRLRHPQGGPGGDEQGPGRGRGAQLRGTDQGDASRSTSTSEWLPAIEVHGARLTTYHSYVQHVDCHIVPFIGTVRLQKVSGARSNGLYAKLAESGRKDGKTRPLPPDRPPRARLPAPRLARRRALGLLAPQPGRRRRPAAARCKRSRDEDLDAPSSSRRSLGSTADDRLHALWHAAGADRHAPRRGLRPALGRRRPRGRDASPCAAP